MHLQNHSHVPYMFAEHSLAEPGSTVDSSQKQKIRHTINSTQILHQVFVDLHAPFLACT